MEKKELIKKLEYTKSAVDFYRLKEEILKHLKGKKPEGGG